MNKFNAILKATALTTFVLATNASYASENDNKEVLIPVVDLNTGKIEYLHCPTYPACNHLLDSTTKDKDKD